MNDASQDFVGVLRAAALDRYLERIGYSGPRRPDLGTLSEVHRRHLEAIAYENVDVLCGVRVDRDPERIWRKIVVEGRGGWCYEMNGLLAWALTELGFEVTRLSGGVMRDVRGDEALGNHLVLRVQLEQPWIADVGLGDGLVEPIPLAEGEHVQGFRRMRLERLGRDARGGGEWRFHNRAGAMPPSFDFYDRPADESRLDEVCSFLQTDPESIFVQNLICQRTAPDRAYQLLGRVLRESPGDRRRLIASEDELASVLREVFGLRVPDLGEVWKRVAERHEAIFGSQPVDDIMIGPPSP